MLPAGARAGSEGTPSHLSSDCVCVRAGERPALIDMVIGIEAVARSERVAGNRAATRAQTSNDKPAASLALEGSKIPET